MIPKLTEFILSLNLIQPMATIPNSVAREYLEGFGQPKRGKVRDTYNCGEGLFTVATDRLSCFDFVTGAEIPDKGAVLTAMNIFWRTGPLKDVIGPKHDLISFGSEVDVLLLRSPGNTLELQKRGIFIK